MRAQHAVPPHLKTINREKLLAIAIAFPRTDSRQAHRGEGEIIWAKKEMTLTAALEVPVDYYTRTKNEQFNLNVTFNYFLP
jgi:hypothetical protein